MTLARIIFWLSHKISRVIICSTFHNQIIEVKVFSECTVMCMFPCQERKCLNVSNARPVCSEVNYYVQTFRVRWWALFVTSESFGLSTIKTRRFVNCGHLLRVSIAHRPTLMTVIMSWRPDKIMEPIKLQKHIMPWETFLWSRVVVTGYGPLISAGRWTMVSAYHAWPSQQ